MWLRLLSSSSSSSPVIVVVIRRVWFYLSWSIIDNRLLLPKTIGRSSSTVTRSGLWAFVARIAELGSSRNECLAANGRRIRIDWTGDFHRSWRIGVLLARLLGRPRNSRRSKSRRFSRDGAANRWWLTSIITGRSRLRRWISAEEITNSITETAFVLCRLGVFVGHRRPTFALRGGGFFRFENGWRHAESREDSPGERMIDFHLNVSGDENHLMLIGRDARRAHSSFSSSWE